ncbi:MAG: nucleotide pyrophosphohydrolase, partial [Fidelibacterota bacterium]
MDKIVSEIRGFAEERDWEKFHTPQNLAVSIIIEVAELLELFQWTFNRVEGSPSFPEKSRIGEELADVVIYCLRLADIEGIDLIKEI